MNSNSESPYLVWDNSTRAELVDFLESQRDSRGDPDLTVVNDFKYSAHKDELRIGGIFIKMYNEQPAYIIKVHNFF